MTVILMSPILLKRSSTLFLKKQSRSSALILYFAGLQLTFPRPCLLDAHRQSTLDSRLPLQIAVPFLWTMMVRFVVFIVA
jgi:hypothetical protein